MLFNRSGMRSGMTMVELVVVIVVSGILASVALPRLAATKEDAKVSLLSRDVGLLYRDLTTASFAQPTRDFNRVAYEKWILDHTNTFQKYKDDDAAVRLRECSADVYKPGSDVRCATVHLGGCSGDWKISFDNSDDGFCKSLTHTLGALSFNNKETHVVF